MGTPVTVFQVSHSEKLRVVAETDHAQTKDNTIVGESAWLVDDTSHLVHAERTRSQNSTAKCRQLLNLII